jgi:hypothetical protein
MYRRFAALLAMPGLAWMATVCAEPTVYHAAQFDVGTAQFGELAGDAFVWKDGAIAFTNPSVGVGSWSDGTDFTWAAHAGFRISGFTVVYDLSFDGTSYLIKGGERDVDFGGLQPGDTWLSTAEFSTTSGAPTRFAGAGSFEQRVTHRTSGDQFNAAFSLVAHGLAEFCPPTNDPSLCGFVLGISLPTRLELESISIRPTVVAIPEPSTVALLSMGLAWLVKRGARRRPA